MTKTYPPCDSSATPYHQKLKTNLWSHYEGPIADPDNQHLQMSLATLQMTTLLRVLPPLSSASPSAEPHLMLAVPARSVPTLAFLLTAPWKAQQLKQALVLLFSALTMHLSLFETVSHCEGLIACSGMDSCSLGY